MLQSQVFYDCLSKKEIQLQHISKHVINFHVAKIFEARGTWEDRWVSDNHPKLGENI